MCRTAVGSFSNSSIRTHGCREKLNKKERFIKCKKFKLFNFALFIFRGSVETCHSTNILIANPQLKKSFEACIESAPHRDGTITVKCYQYVKIGFYKQSKGSNRILRFLMAWMLDMSYCFLRKILIE